MKKINIENYTEEEIKKIKEEAFIVTYTYEDTVNLITAKKEKEERPKTTIKYLIKDTEDYYALRELLKYKHEFYYEETIGKYVLNPNGGKDLRNQYLKDFMEENPGLRTIDYYIRFQKIMGLLTEETLAMIDVQTTRIGYLNDLLTLLGKRENGSQKIDLNRLAYKKDENGNRDFSRQDLRNVGTPYELLNELIYNEHGWPVKHLIYILEKAGITNEDLLALIDTIKCDIKLANKENIANPEPIDEDELEDDDKHRTAGNVIQFTKTLQKKHMPNIQSKQKKG